jgi:hypothetical protein
MKISFFMGENIVKNVWPLASPKSDILGLSNAHTSMGAAFALLCLAPSEPTCCTSEMSINEFITASEVCKRFT